MGGLIQSRGYIAGDLILTQDGAGGWLVFREFTVVGDIDVHYGFVDSHGRCVSRG